MKKPKTQDELASLKEIIRSKLREKNIEHTTIEFETANENCCFENCCE